jgi:hypothetical protein
MIRAKEQREQGMHGHVQVLVDAAAVVVLQRCAGTAMSNAERKRTCSWHLLLLKT